MKQQSPFSIYDFMGYLIPGATSIYIFYYIKLIKVTSDFDVFKLLKQVPDLNLGGILFFIILSYVLGHIISFVSSLTIENYANWKYGYPSKYLLDITPKSYLMKEDKKRVKAWKIIIFILLFPLTISDFIFGRLLGFRIHYSKKLDSFLVDFINIKIEKLFKLIGVYDNLDINKYEPTKSDFQRIISHYSFENSKNHQGKLMNYISLYGFLRTFTVIFIGLFYYYTHHILVFFEFTWQFAIIDTIIAGLSYLFFMAFMKFYRRYTLEGLMIMCADKDLV